METAGESRSPAQTWRMTDHTTPDHTKVGGETKCMEEKTDDGLDTDRLLYPGNKDAFNQM